MSRSYLSTVLACLVLAACGGGGGGSGSGSSSSSSSSSGGSAGRNLTLTLSTNTINVLGFAPTAGTPVSQPLTGTIAGTASGTVFVLVSTSDPAVATVGPINLGATSATADILPAAVAALGPGSHTATITVRACVNDSTCATNQVNGSPATVTVNYRIEGTQSSVSSLTFNVGNTPQPADLTRAFSVSSYPLGGWTAVSDIPVLSPAPATGGTAIATPVTATIDPAALEEFSGGTYTGRIRFTPNAAGLAPFDLPVTVNVMRTRVNFVSPHVAVAGTTNTVIIRGENLNAAPPTGVLFGTTPATSFQVVSDTEIHATHPALTAGAYTVHVSNAQGIDRTTAVLHVVSGGALPAAALDYPDGPGALAFTLLHDARRGALIVQLFYNTMGSTSQVVRYAYTSGSWQQTGRIHVPHRSSIALSANGEALFLAHGGAATFSVEERDPVSLALVRTTSASNYFHEAFSMAVANDGNVLIETNSTCCSTAFQELLFSPLRRTIQPMISPGGRATTPPMTQHSGPTVASADGSKVLIADTQNQITMRYHDDLETVYFKDPAQFPRPYFLQLAMNRRGSLMVSPGSGVYDANFTLIGQLPNTARQFGISPELPRAYTFDENGTLRSFDTVATPVNGFLAEVLPAVTPAVDPDAFFGAAPIVVSPDGLTSFTAGRARLLVQPLP